MRSSRLMINDVLVPGPAILASARLHNCTVLASFFAARYQRDDATKEMLQPLSSLPTSHLFGTMFCSAEAILFKTYESEVRPSHALADDD